MWIQIPTSLHNKKAAKTGISQKELLNIKSSLYSGNRVQAWAGRPSLDTHYQFLTYCSGTRQSFSQFLDFYSNYLLMNLVGYGNDLKAMPGTCFSCEVMQ